MPALKHPRFWDEAGITLRLGSAAVTMEGDQPRIGFDDGTTLVADGVILAHGAAPRKLPLTAPATGVYTLRTLDDALAVRAALAVATSVAIIGGGFIGLEVASAAARRELPVTVLERDPVPLCSAVGEITARRITATAQEAGVRLLAPVEVTALLGTDTVRGVLLSDGTQVDADVVVVGIGVAPNTQWLAGSGIETGDGVVCDALLRTSHPRIFAAGDIASWVNPAYDERMRIEHWTTAREHGKTAAQNLLRALTGETAGMRPMLHIPYVWSDQFRTKIQIVGRLGEAECVVHEIHHAPDRFVAHYVRNGALQGAVTINKPREAMMLRKRLFLERQALNVTR